MGAEVFHDSLAREAVPDAGFIVWVGSCESRMVVHEGEYSSATATSRRPG
jgi:hypothetical protein